jgi:hypothetical protein
MVSIFMPAPRVSLLAPAQRALHVEPLCLIETQFLESGHQADTNMSCHNTSSGV